MARVLRIPVSARFSQPEPWGVGRQCRRVVFPSTGGIEVHGWLTEPCNGPPTALAVIGHGYGGRSAPDLNPPSPGMACLYPCARGLGATDFPGLPTDRTEFHVVHGIENPETYILAGCVEDWARAASEILAAFPECQGPLVFQGGSFGGGIGALLLAADKRFRGAVLVDPTFGNQPLRHTLSCTGSGSAVAAYVAQHPSVETTLALFDSASAARQIEIPCLVVVSLFDPAVPPPSQFATANAISGARILVKSAGHFEHPNSQAEDSEIRREIGEFLQDLAVDGLVQLRNGCESRFHAER